MVLGLSFYPLEQAPKHGDLCNEQIRDSNERFNLVRGGCWPPSQGTNARRCCQKIHLLTSGGSASSVTFPSFWEISFTSQGGCSASLNPVFQVSFARWISAINQWLNDVLLERPNVSWLVCF